MQVGTVGRVKGSLDTYIVVGEWRGNLALENLSTGTEVKVSPSDFEPATLELDVTTVSNGGEPTDTLQTITARLAVKDREAALELAAAFPKSLKVRGFGVSCRGPGYGIVELHVDLRANESNDGYNETGVKRYRSLRKHAERLGIPVVYRPRFRNSVATEARFEELLGGAAAAVSATPAELELVERGIINDPRLGAASSMLGGLFRGETAPEAEARVQRERAEGRWS